MAIVQIVGSILVLASLNIQALSFSLNRSKQLLTRGVGGAASTQAHAAHRPPHEVSGTMEPPAFFMAFF